MQYLSLKRSRLIIGAFVAFSIFALVFPDVDLRISGMFYDGGFFLRDQWWQGLLQRGLGYFLGATLSVVIGLYLRNKLLKRSDCVVCGRKVLYVFLVMIIGAGLIVNQGFKNNFGRARPRDIAEFGGAREFTPAFVPAHQCGTNCSFSSGDAAGAFYSLALVLAFRRQRRWL